MNNPNQPNDLMRQLRHEYSTIGIAIESMMKDPMVQFDEWFQAAVAAGIREPNGMTLSTVGEDARPSARIVLLKQFDQRGFVFYTNYQSQKGQEMAANRNVSLTFWWPELERQIRINGLVDKVSDAESDAYFQSRPRGSQLGAWTSPQSEEIDSRERLDEAHARYHAQYAAEDSIPRPPFWGGYRVTPELIEFWQGRKSRLHDRVVFELNGDGQWEKKRLAP